MFLNPVKIIKHYRDQDLLPQVMKQIRIRHPPAGICSGTKNVDIK
jgi:hypothetical protein